MGLILLGLGGLTFVLSGLDVLTSSACNQVTWGRQGGRYQSIAVTCWDAATEGSMDGNIAGALMVVAGIAIIAFAGWVAWSRY